MKKIYILLLMCFAVQSFGQGASLSPHDLKESYKEKKVYFLTEGSKVISAAGQKELDRIVELLATNAPNSYEYHLVSYYHSNYQISGDDHLFKAYKLRPDDADVNKALFGYYILKGNKTKQKEFALKIKSNYSSKRVTYYEQLFKGQTGDYIIFSGEKDAYPALILQSLGKVSTDIKIINLDFLKNPSYQKTIKSGFGSFNLDFLGNEKAFIGKLVNSKLQTVLVSTTVNQAYLRDCANSLYLYGLVYKRDPVNQFSALADFWNSAQVFFKDFEVDSRYDKSLYVNFIPPLLTLYQLKKENGENTDTLNKGIKLLSQRLGVDYTVNELLKGYDKVE